VTVRTVESTPPRESGQDRLKVSLGPCMPGCEVRFVWKEAESHGRLQSGGVPRREHGSGAGLFLPVQPGSEVPLREHQEAAVEEGSLCLATRGLSLGCRNLGSCFLCVLRYTG
jgi:hypothetical protein